jgi:hypothetical protein
MKLDLISGPFSPYLVGTNRGERMSHQLTYQANLARIDDLHRQAATHRLAAGLARSRQRKWLRRRRLSKPSLALRPSERIA